MSMIYFRGKKINEGGKHLAVPLFLNYILDEKPGLNCETGLMWQMRLGSIHCRSSAMFWKPLNTSKLTWSMSHSEQVNVFRTPTKKRQTGAKFEWKEKKASREKLFSWEKREESIKPNKKWKKPNTPNVGKQCWDVWLHLTKVKYYIET